MGLFVLIGFIIHLVLDEIYSVDVEGAVIKKSFGTALKLFDYHSWRASGLMAIALAGRDVRQPACPRVLRRDRVAAGAVRLPEGPFAAQGPMVRHAASRNDSSARNRRGRRPENAVTPGVPAKAGPHGSPIQGQCFLLT